MLSPEEQKQIVMLYTGWPFFIAGIWASYLHKIEMLTRHRLPKSKT